MVIKKIKKHLPILKRRLNQQGEVSRIVQYRNASLNIILNAFLKVKQAKFDQKEQEAFNRSEAYRQRLLNDETPVSFAIFGSDKTETVKSICKKAASSRKWGQFYYQICKQLDQPVFLEIGTNLAKI